VKVSIVAQRPENGFSIGILQNVRRSDHIAMLIDTDKNSRSFQDRLFGIKVLDWNSVVERIEHDL